MQRVRYLLISEKNENLRNVISAEIYDAGLGVCGWLLVGVSGLLSVNLASTLGLLHAMDFYYRCFSHGFYF